MTATVELSDLIGAELEALARQEGSSISEILQRLATEHVKRQRSPISESRDVPLPLVPASDGVTTGPFTGEYLDELFAREDHAS